MRCGTSITDSYDAASQTLYVTATGSVSVRPPTGSKPDISYITHQPDIADPQGRPSAVYETCDLAAKSPLTSVYTALYKSGPAALRTPRARPNLSGRSDMGKGTCSVDGCEGVTGVPGTARGYCNKHYNRWLPTAT